MSNNKQSSVELLAITIYEKFKMEGNGKELNDLVEQAKAMHKEEMIKFAKDYWTESDTGKYTNAEIFYEQTFGGNK